MTVLAVLTVLMAAGVAVTTAAAVVNRAQEDATGGGGTYRFTEVRTVVPASRVGEGKKIVDKVATTFAFPTAGS